MEIKGHTYALVTGGTSGMGLEYVRQLAARGYNVVIAALPGKTSELEPANVASVLKEEFPELDFLPVPINLARVEAGEELVATIMKERPDAVLEVLVNNAGMLQASHFKDLTVKGLQTELLLHNLTVATLCHLLLPDMVKRHKGYVLNVSSLAAWTPFPYISTYCATKSFNRMLTKALRTEYKGSGVNIATVYFGAVDTPLLKLKPSYRKLARRLTVMIGPDKAVRKALNMLFHGHSGRMPGLLNKLALVFCPLIPRPVLAWIDRKASAKIEAGKV